MLTLADIIISTAGFFFLIMSVGPVFAGIVQDMNQGTVEGSGEFPTELAYNTIFVISALISLASAILAFLVSRTKSLQTVNAADV